MKKAAKKQPKPKPYVGPIWKAPSEMISGRKVSPSRNNPKYSIEVHEDGSRTKWGPFKIEKDSIPTARGQVISPIKRPPPKPKPLTDCTTAAKPMANKHHAMSAALMAKPATTTTMRRSGR